MINDIVESGKDIKHFLGDKPKRSNAKGTLGHSSNFPCEYCFSRGVPISSINYNLSLAEKKNQLNFEKSLVTEKLREAEDEGEKKN